jgi:hypothetical protein
VTVAALGSQVSGLLLSNCDDMRVYFRLAETLVRLDDPAVVVMCYPQEPYEASWVFRFGKAVHAFLPLDQGQATAQHYVGAAESHVDAPLSEGLALAGFDRSVNASRVCEILGGHKHG